MFDIGVYPICYANRMANSSILKVSRFQDEALIEYENGCVAHIGNKLGCGYGKYSSYIWYKG